LGVHYFGDLLTARGYGGAWNPYDDALPLPAQHLPSGQLFMMLLSIVHIDFIFILYISFSLALLFFAIRTLANTVFRITLWKYAQLFLLFCVMGMPMLIDFDRGALQTIALAGTILFFSYGLREKWVVAILWLLFAASLKPYLLIFSIAFLSRKNFWAHVLLGFSFVSLNVLLMQAFSGNFLEGFRSMWGAISRYGSEFGFPWIANSGSLVGSAHRIVEFFFGSEVSAEFLKGTLWAFPIISLALVLLGLGIWYRSHLPIWVRLMGPLSIISVAQPGSIGYHWGWVGVVVIIFLVDLMKKSSTDSGDYSPWFLQIVAGLALVPSWISFPSPSGDVRQIGNHMILTPILVSGLIYWLVKSYRKTKNVDSSLGL
jgi:hypothetical protein